MTAIGVEYVSIIKEESFIKSNQNELISSDYPYCLKYRKKNENLIKT